MRVAVGALFMFFGTIIAAEASQERSQVAAQRFSYWRCLASAVVATLPTRISGEEFAVYVKEKCVTEGQRFRSALTAYFAKTMPSKTTVDHMMSADLVISTTQEDAISVYNNLRR
jgi:hypothetical protein